MNIASILPPEAVLASIEGRDKKQVLKTMAGVAATLTGLELLRCGPALSTLCGKTGTDVRERL